MDQHLDVLDWCISYDPSGPMVWVVADSGWCAAAQPCPFTPPYPRPFSRSSPPPFAACANAQSGADLNSESHPPPAVLPPPPPHRVPAVRRRARQKRQTHVR